MQPANGTKSQLFASWVRYWVVLSIINVLFVGNLKLAEALAGMVIAGLAALAMVAVRWYGSIDYRFRAAWIGRVARVPLQIFPDSFRLLFALLNSLAGRPFHGRFVEIKFDPGGDDAESAARRVLVVAAISIPPNSFVTRVDCERGCIEIHQLEPAAVAPHGDARWPL